MARSLPTSDGRIGRTLVWLFGLTLALGLAAPGQAQQTPDDHLKCYRIVDSTKLNAQVDLDTEQFGLERECRVQSAELFCAPAAKTVIEAEVGGEPVELLPIFGSDELTDYLCYRLMCAQPDIDAQVVSDQFGTRKIKFLKSELLCVPAIKGTPPPPCGPSSLGQCAGECPNLDDECTVLATGDCACLPPTERCGVRTDGTCGGECPVTTDVCTTSPLGCRCEPDKRCGIQPDGACGGECPNPTDICKGGATGAGCECVPELEPCGFDANGVCGGGCPVAGDVCTDLGTDCKCVRPGDTCSDALWPTCGGPCPAPDMCLPTEFGNCECLPAQECGFTPDGALCGGSCPDPSTVCGALLFDCVCVTPGLELCSPDAAGQCGGVCIDQGGQPTGVCRPAVGAEGCFCDFP